VKYRQCHKPTASHILNNAKATFMHNFSCHKLPVQGLRRMATPVPSDAKRRMSLTRWQEEMMQRWCRKNLFSLLISFCEAILKFLSDHSLF